MHRVRGSKARPDIHGHGRSSVRGVHLQHIDATDATRDAHIAASKAFVHNQEKCGPEAPQTLFPDPLVGALPRITQYSDAESNACPSKSQSGGRPQSGSIRFVQNGGQTISSARLETTRANTRSTPGVYQTPLRNAASSNIHPALRCTAASDSNYSQYTSSLPNTPINKQKINKTWSASQGRNKENFRDAAARSARTRNTIHISTAPRRTIMSQRHWPRPPSRGSMRNKTTIAPSFGNRSLQAATEVTESTTHPFGQRAYFPDAAIKTDPACEYKHQTSGVYSATQRRPFLATPSLQSSYNGGCFQKDTGYLHPRPTTDITVGTATIPPSCPTISKSFLRSHRKRNFSFSSNDDDKFRVVPSNMDSSHKRLSLRSPHKEEKGMRKSLRQNQPQTPRPSVLPEQQELDINALEGEEADGNEASNTGSLRRTASRMSKRVKMRLRSFWSHTKSDSSSEQVPEQHIEASMPHGVLYSGQEFMSEREGRLSISNGLHTSSECNDTGTVVHDGYGYETGEAVQSEVSGETSRFTSWSSSVRRASSTASNRQPASEFPPQQLPVISEGNGQPEVSTPNASPRLKAPGHPPMRNLSDDPRRLSQAQVPGAAPRKLADRDAALLASGIRLRHAAQLYLSSSSSSSSSSPSLASSGRGATPRQAIAPAALRRLQELSLNLQKVCQEEGKENAAKVQTNYDDPFYDDRDKKRDILFAFQSAPTTPADPSLPDIPNLPPVATGQTSASPQYFFRGKSPFRRALRESMKTFEGETTAFRAQHRGRVDGGCGRPVGANPPEQTYNEQPKEIDDDAPLLQSDGAGQWSRVQAWQASLVPDSSTRSDSAHSPRGRGQASCSANESSDFRAIVSQGLCASITSLGDGTERTPVARPAQPERLHRDTVVSAEQLRLWINRSVDMEEMGSPWSSAVPGHHTRENAEHAEHDESMV